MSVDENDSVMTSKSHFNDDTDIRLCIIIVR